MDWCIRKHLYWFHHGFSRLKYMGFSVKILPEPTVVGSKFHRISRTKPISRSFSISTEPRKRNKFNDPANCQELMVFLGCFLCGTVPHIDPCDFHGFAIKKQPSNARLEYPHDLGKHHSGFGLDQWKKLKRKLWFSPMKCGGVPPNLTSCISSHACIPTVSPFWLDLYPNSG